MRLFCFFASFVLVFATFGRTFAADDKFYDLLLAGGALKTCSSMFTKNCAENVRFTDAKKSDLYAFSPSALARFKSLHEKYQFEDKKFENVYSALVNIVETTPTKNFHKSDFLDALEHSANIKGFTDTLPDNIYFALLDSHEVSQFTDKQNRKKEQVSLLGTTNPNSIEIYKTFFKQAKMRVKTGSVRIGVVTASSRDPFAVADFYQSVFSHTGADAEWLPLSPALMDAWEHLESDPKACEKFDKYRAKNTIYDRGRVYPDLAEKEKHWCENPEIAIETISSLQGIFLNGGDQSKTVRAFRFTNKTASPVLRAIQQAVVSRKLIVGGTSAGTAVQAGGMLNQRPIPMFTNGAPETALSYGAIYYHAPSARCSENESCQNAIPSNAITLDERGGLGLFNIGLLDTHFSERDREARLIAATAQSGHRLGFGVDETTALLVALNSDSAEFSVIGENGVFVVDMHNGRLERQWQGNELSHTMSGLAHYWSSGSFTSLNNGQWQMALAGQSKVQTSAATMNRVGEWRSQIDKKCGTRQAVAWDALSASFFVSPTKETRFLHSNTTGCSYHSLPFSVSAR